LWRLISEDQATAVGAKAGHFGQALHRIVVAFSNAVLECCHQSMPKQ
jgi:hypothetical protein